MCMVRGVCVCVCVCGAGIRGVEYSLCAEACWLALNAGGLHGQAMVQAREWGCGRTLAATEASSVKHSVTPLLDLAEHSR